MTQLTEQIPANDEQPSSYDRLQGALAPHLSNVVIVHPLDATVDSSPGDIKSIGDSLSDERMFEPSYVENALSHIDATATDDATINEKRACLYDVSQALKVASAAHAEINGETVAIRWHEASLTLLDLGGQAEDQNRKQGLLAAAVVAAQLNPDADKRIDFLKTAYDKDLQPDLAEACAASHVAVKRQQDTLVPGLFDQTDVLYIEDTASVFRLKPKVMYSYLDTIRPQAKSQDIASAKSAQRAVVKAMEASGNVSEAVEDQARGASVNGEKVHGVTIDTRKIERFALQEAFLRRQMPVIIGEKDFEHSPLAEELRRSHQQPDTSSREILVSSSMRPENLSHEMKRAIDRLRLDTEAAFIKLSAPVIEEFKTDRQPGQGYDNLTEEQVAAVRFKAVIREVAQIASVASFIDAQQHVQRTSEEPLFAGVSMEDEVWSNSENGAAVPIACADIIKRVMELAAASPELEASPEELRGVIHDNRRELLATATYNIVDFSAQSGSIVNAPGSLHRDADNKLVLMINPRPGIKDHADIYAAVTLGCPALRVIHEQRGQMNQLDKIAYGSSNYVDHAMAAVINAAYERGLLDLSNFPPPIAFDSRMDRDYGETDIRELTRRIPQYDPTQGPLDT